MKIIKLDKESKGTLQRIYDEAHGIQLLLIDLSIRKNHLEQQAKEVIEKITKHKCTVYFDTKGKIIAIKTSENSKT